MKGVGPVTDQELRAESLTVLPQRMETCQLSCGGWNGFWGNNGCWNNNYWRCGSHFDGGVRLHGVIIDNRQIYQSF